MSDSHDDRHGELLAAIAAGERGADEPEAAHLLRSCPKCREDLAALREAARHVERAGDALRAVIAESRGVHSAPGLDDVAPTLQRLAAERRVPRRPSRVLWLAAAALLFLVIGPLVAYRLWTAGDAPTAPVMLGSDELELVEPIGEVRDYERFVWKYSGEPNGFDLRIFDQDAPDAKPLRVRCEEPIWVPDAEARAKLPARIRWTVDALDAFRKDPVASKHASAQRSSR